MCDGCVVALNESRDGGHESGRCHRTYICTNAGARVGDGRKGRQGRAHARGRRVAVCEWCALRSNNIVTLLLFVSERGGTTFNINIRVMQMDQFEFKGLNRGNVTLNSSGKQPHGGTSGRKASQESSSGALSGTSAQAA